MRHVRRYVPIKRGVQRLAQRLAAHAVMSRAISVAPSPQRGRTSKFASGWHVMPSENRLPELCRALRIGIIGSCGIPGTARQPEFGTGYLNYCARHTPNRHHVDMAYLAFQWTQSDGICQSAIDYLFGHLM
jgi:hypothetical protein